MAEKKLSRVDLIERNNLETMQDKKIRLKKALTTLKKTLSEDFFENAYDFSEQEIQMEFISTVKRLFHPKAIKEKDSTGKKQIVSKNLDHNSEDKSIILDRTYIEHILSKVTPSGKVNGVDSTEVPKAEYKSSKAKSINTLNLFNNLSIGQIDKIDEKENGKHNIYNLDSKVSLVSGIFEGNTIKPIVVFHIKHTKFQPIVNKLIQEKASEYRKAIKRIERVNKLIRAKRDGYRVGDEIQLPHLKNRTIINGDQENPSLIQTPRDTLTLRLGDFVAHGAVEIIHLNDKWKKKIIADTAWLDQNPIFKSQIRQYYTTAEFNKAFPPVETSAEDKVETKAKRRKP